MTQPEATTPSRPRWGRYAAWGGLIALLAITMTALINAQQGSLRKGQPAPTFSVTTFDGQAFSLADLKGKVVLVNFWASWCSPCAEEADELEAAWQYFQGNEEVVFLGIAWSDMDTKAKSYLAEYAITYPNAPDSGTRASQAYRITGVPETFIIDRNGVLAYTKFSQFNSPEEIVRAVENVLNAAP